MFFIYPTNSKQDVLYMGKVHGKVRSRELCRKIWGEDKNITYSYVIFLKDISTFNVSKANIYKKLNYNRICGITRLSGDRIELMQDLINSNPNKIEKKNNYDKIKSELINKFWSNKTYEIEIYENIKKNKNKSKRMDKNKKGFRIDIDSEFPSKIVGWTGEKILYEELNKNIYGDKNYRLLEKLNLKDIKKSKAELIWFNSNINIDDPNADDYSIGKGYDLELRLYKRKIKFEVKSSINNLSIFTLTKNELIEMKNSGIDYYLILVDRLKTTPRIRIIKNFSEYLTEEYVSMSLEHKLLINEIDEKFLIN